MLPTFFLALFMRLRATHWNRIRVTGDLFESALRYGLIPMQLPPSEPEPEIAVHFIVEGESGEEEDHGHLVYRHHITGRSHGGR